jgi:hypothetical protein
MAEVIPGEDKKKRSGCNGDTLRRDALQRVDRAVCGRVISCSRGQERWRTELELCGCESFDDDHRSAALGTAPQRGRCRSALGRKTLHDATHSSATLRTPGIVSEGGSANAWSSRRNGQSATCSWTRAAWARASEGARPSHSFLPLSLRCNGADLAKALA